MRVGHRGGCALCPGVIAPQSALVSSVGDGDGRLASFIVRAAGSSIVWAAGSSIVRRCRDGCCDVSLGGCGAEACDRIRIMGYYLEAWLGFV